MTAGAGNGPRRRPGSTGGGAKGGRPRKKASAAKSPGDEVTLKTATADGEADGASEKAGVVADAATTDLSPNSTASGDGAATGALPSEKAEETVGDVPAADKIGVPEKTVRDEEIVDDTGHDIDEGPQKVDDAAPVVDVVDDVAAGDVANVKEVDGAKDVDDSVVDVKETVRDIGVNDTVQDIKVPVRPPAASPPAKTGLAATTALPAANLASTAYGHKATTELPDRGEPALSPGRTQAMEAPRPEPGAGEPAHTPAPTPGSAPSPSPFSPSPYASSQAPARPSTSPTTSVTPAAAGEGRAAEKTTAGRRAPRKAHLQVARFDPWSVMKFSFIMSLVCFLVLFVAVAVLYMILSMLGVFDALSGSIRDLTSNDQGKAGGIDPAGWFSPARILGYTALIGTLNVLLITALATVWSVIYNMAADFVGGVEVTLKEADQ